MPKNITLNENQSDTGGSCSYNYGHVDLLESHARMIRFDQ
jgi:hypothetical protein